MLVAQSRTAHASGMSRTLSPRRVVCWSIAIAGCNGSGTPKALDASLGGLDAGVGAVPREAGKPGRLERLPVKYRNPAPVSSTCDGGFLPQTVVDAGAPPTDCVAPCVWELIKKCLPESPCGTENHWQKVDAPLNGLRGSYGYSVYMDGRLCYGYWWGGVPPSGLQASWGWTDEKGTQVAWGITSTGGPSRSTSCGPMCLPPRSGPINGGWCPEASYYVDPSQPHCAPWRALYQF